MNAFYAPLYIETGKLVNFLKSLKVETVFDYDSVLLDF